MSVGFREDFRTIGFSKAYASSKRVAEKATRATRVLPRAIHASELPMHALLHPAWARFGYIRMRKLQAISRMDERAPEGRYVLQRASVSTLLNQQNHQPHQYPKIIFMLASLMPDACPARDVTRISPPPCDLQRSSSSRWRAGCAPSPFLPRNPRCGAWC
jgi:hypothetical protein